ncbi:hypothetical protein CRYUN_Cryun01aG0037600 [Craigia yunnanensis]
MECFTKNDIIFANRPYFWVGKYIGYDYTSLGTSPYCDHWRNLRRICKLEIQYKLVELVFEYPKRRNQDFIAKIVSCFKPR